MHDLIAQLARPRTRAECIDGPRPCPWLGCRFHLARVGVVGHRRGPRIRLGEITLDAAATDAEIEHAVDAELARLERVGDTCSLDVAERGGFEYGEVGRLIGLTRERVRQILVGAYAALPRRELLELQHVAGVDVGAQHPALAAADAEVGGE